MIVIRAYEDLPPAAVASDSVAPVVAVVAAPASAAPVMRMRTSCDERCSVSAQGVLRVASRRYPVAASAREADAGHAATLVIAVRGRDRARVRSALRRAGRRTLAVALTARDSAGNKRVVKRMFHLRKPS